MHTHPNARLTPLGRERLVRRHIDEHVPLAELACHAGISLRTAYKWLARFRSGGPAALVDRRSVRRTQRRTLDPQQQQQATALRHERCTVRRIAKSLAAPLSTTGRWLKSMGLGRLKNLQPKEPVRRYQWAQPGDMIHVDTKQLARFERVGHRITGDRRLGCSPGAGYEKAHVAVDDATRLAYVEVLPDEQQATTVGFLVRAVSWFNSQGITCRRVLSDNGSAYRSKQWRQACGAMGLKAKRTRAYRPQTNGKAERYDLRSTSSTSRLCRPSGLMPCLSPVQRSASAGCLGVCRSITAAGATWPSAAALPFSSSKGCGSLNDLVRKHKRPDVFWTSSLEQLEELVLQLLAKPEGLRGVPVAPPPYWELKDLLKAALAP